MAKALDYDKFFNVGKSKAGDVTKVTTKTTTTPPELDGMQSFLKNLNQTLGLVNSTLGNLGIDSSVFKDKLKEKIGMAQQRQQVVQQPYVENFRTPPKPPVTAEVKETKTENKKMDFDKIIKILDLVISLKGEECTLKEVKAFAEENKNIIEGLIK